MPSTNAVIRQAAPRGSGQSNAPAETHPATTSASDSRHRRSSRRTLRSSSGTRSDSLQPSIHIAHAFVGAPSGP